MRIIMSIIHAVIVAAIGLAAPAASANPVVLPAGWVSSPPTNNMVAIQISGSEDVVIIGIMDVNEPGKLAGLLASQTTPSFTITETSQPKQLGNGMFLATSNLQFKDGRKGLTISRAGLRPDGKTAMAAIMTPNPNDMPNFQTRVTAVTEILKALIAGGSLPK